MIGARSSTFNSLTLQVRHQAAVTSTKTTFSSTTSFYGAVASKERQNSPAIAAGCSIGETPEGSKLERVRGFSLYWALAGVAPEASVSASISRNTR